MTSMELNVSEDTNGTEGNEDDNSILLIPRSIRFALLLAFVVPSLIAYLFLIISLLTNKTQRSAPNNYVILFILFFSLVIVCADVPFAIDSYGPHPLIALSRAFCLTWWLISLCFFYICQILVVWASFERHLLIFHKRFLNKKWSKIFFHYAPPLLLIAYMLSFYIYAIFFYPCDDVVDFEAHTCIFPCYVYDPLLSLWETIFHGMLITFGILVLNSALLIRVYRSKARLRQSINWRKYRQMIFQLVSIAVLYLLNNIPYSIVNIFFLAGWEGWPLPVLNCLNYLFYSIPLFFPFLCLGTIPEVTAKLKRILRLRTNRQIAAISMRTFTIANRPVVVQT